MSTYYVWAVWPEQIKANGLVSERDGVRIRSNIPTLEEARRVQEQTDQEGRVSYVESE